MAGAAVSTSRVTPAEGYRVWARTYDQELNPMLTLERRFLAPLLPPLDGLDIVDLGCGTGRWLHFLRDAGARSLLGVDFSVEMLRQAEAKLGASAELLCGDCGETRLGDESADLVLCNFVLTYVPDWEELLQTASRILRPGGSLILTDVHPGTAERLGWRRGPQQKESFEDIQTNPVGITQLIARAADAGLEVALRLEPCFGKEERDIFERNGKQEYFEAIREFPAIYILQLRRHRRLGPAPSGLCDPRAKSLLRGARLAFGAADQQHGNLEIAGTRLTSIQATARGDGRSVSQEDAVDLRGYLVFPGLMNAHDHLEFALFPRLGNGGYQNFLEWADQIHHSHAELIARHRQVPREVRLWWGGIRNLLCGVTTVCHHNPYETQVFTEDFAVRVLKDFGWAHSLKLEPQVAARKSANPKRQPFFIHLAEGIDRQSAEELAVLDRMGALDSDTVIIHGIGLDAEGESLLRKSNAGLVWCPRSNLFLFGKTLAPELLGSLPRVAIGSDSPLTATGDLLDEVNCAYRVLDTSPEKLYNFVTRGSADLLRLRNGEGSLRVDGLADLFVVRDSGLSPADTLANLSYRDVELVLLGGRVQLASPQLLDRLPQQLRSGLQPLWIEDLIRWIRAPLASLFSQAEAYLGEEIFLGGRRVRFGN